MSRTPSPPGGVMRSGGLRTLVEEGPGRHRAAHRVGRRVRSRWDAARLPGKPLTAAAAFCTPTRFHGARDRAHLYRKASSIPPSPFAAFAPLSIVIDEGKPRALSCSTETSGETIAVHARAVLLATGGLGRDVQGTRTRTSPPATVSPWLARRRGDRALNLSVFTPLRFMSRRRRGFCSPRRCAARAAAAQHGGRALFTDELRKGRGLRAIAPRCARRRGSRVSDLTHRGRNSSQALPARA